MGLNFFEQLQKVRANQKVSLRDENKQTYKKKEGMKMLDYDKDKIAKVLVFKQLKFPLNPLTGVEDEAFNYENPFRTNTSIGTTLENLIPLWKDDVKLAKEEGRESIIDKISSFTGIDLDEGILDNPVELHKVLRDLELPQIFTLPAIGINCTAVTNTEYTKRYVVNFDRDQWDAIDDYDEKSKARPSWDYLHSLFLTIANIQVEELKKTPEYEAMSEDDKKTARKNIWAKNPLDTERPMNWTFGLELPLDEEEFTVEGGLDSFTEEKIRKHLRVIKLTGGLTGSLADIKPEGKTHKRDDLHTDFYEFEFSCGKEDPKTDRGLLVKNSKFTAQKGALRDEAGYEEFVKRVNSVIDSLTQNGKISLDDFMKPNLKAAVYSPVVEEKLFQALKSLYPYEEVIKILEKSDDALIYQAKALELLYGDKFDASLIEGATSEEEDAQAKALRNLMGEELGETPEEKLDKEFAEKSTNIFEEVEV